MWNIIRQSSKGIELHKLVQVFLQVNSLLLYPSIVYLFLKILYKNFYFRISWCFASRFVWLRIKFEDFTKSQNKGEIILIIPYKNMIFNVEITTFVIHFIWSRLRKYLHVYNNCSNYFWIILTEKFFKSI